MRNQPREDIVILRAVVRLAIVPRLERVIATQQIEWRSPSNRHPLAIIAERHRTIGLTKRRFDDRARAERHRQFEQLRHAPAEFIAAMAVILTAA
ncbi:hypothetical protein [Nitratireductor sp. XY-223]|uniref:hypothetical protein n=1 Tax=Nitratireductor sp. XY-223 TaxID=2561926 RepID=UPI0010A9A163|nr:hypothetical protein [Nitratireductor sp. XY-223]